MQRRHALVSSCLTSSSLAAADLAECQTTLVSRQIGMLARSRSSPSTTASCSTSPARCRCSPPATICWPSGVCPPAYVVARARRGGGIGHACRRAALVGRPSAGQPTRLRHADRRWRTGRRRGAAWTRTCWHGCGDARPCARRVASVCTGRIPARGGRAPRRSARGNALGALRPAGGRCIPQCAWSPIRSSSPMGTSGPRPASPPGSTWPWRMVEQDLGRERRSPSRAGWWCSSSGRAGRRNSAPPWSCSGASASTAARLDSRPSRPAISVWRLWQPRPP